MTGAKLTRAEYAARYRARRRGEDVPDIRRRRTPEERKAYKAEWTRANAERVSASQKAWRDRNRELLRARQAESRAANRDRNRAYQAKYYQAHREDIREQANLRTVRWRAENPDRARESATRTRLRRQALTTTCEHVACLALGATTVAWSVNPHRCYLCGTPVRLHAKRIDSDRCEMDHVVPITRGGLHCAENLRPACAPCNRLKSNKLLSEMGVAA
jgi:5-methylcytosine-specific restriction endonuclease McrA